MRGREGDSGRGGAVESIEAGREGDERGKGIEGGKGRGELDECR